MPRDVRTRWNSTYDMLDFAYDYKDAVNKITAIREMKLRKYEIEPDEWEMVRQLRDLLKVVFICSFIPTLISEAQIFKDTTLFFSRDGSPNIASVIPAMDHIDNHLATAAIDRVYSPAIRAALALGKWTLNRYYDRTDHSEIYRIAMSMLLAFPFEFIYIIY